MPPPVCLWAIVRRRAAGDYWVCPANDPEGPGRISGISRLHSLLGTPSHPSTVE